MRRRKLSITSMSSPNPLTASSGSVGRPVISGPLPLQKRTPATAKPPSRVSSTYSTASSVSRYSGESYRSDMSKATVKSSTSNSAKTPAPILKHSASVHSSLRSVGSARPHAGRRSLPSSTDSRRHAIVGMPSGDGDDDLDLELMSYTSFYSERSSLASNASSKRDVDHLVPRPRVVEQRRRCISTSTTSSRNVSTRVSCVSNATSSVYSCDTDAYAYEEKPLPPIPDKPAIRQPRNPTTPTRRVTFASDETSDHPSTEMGNRLSEFENFDIAPAITQMVKRFKKIQKRVSSGQQVDLTTLSSAFSEALGSVLDTIDNVPWDIRASTSFNLAWEDIILHQQQFHKRSNLMVTDDQPSLSDDIIKTIERTMFSTKRLLDDVQGQLDSSRTIPPLPFETEDGSEIIIFPQQLHSSTPQLVSNEYMPSRAASFVESPADDDTANHSTPTSMTVNTTERTNFMSSSTDSLSTSPTSSDSNGRASTLFSRKSSSASESSMESFSEEILQYLDYSDKGEASKAQATIEDKESDRTQAVTADFVVPPARPRPRRKTGRDSLAVHRHLLENVRSSMILFPEFSGERQSTEFLGGIPEEEVDTDEVLYGNGQNGKFLKGLSLRRIVAQICSKNSLDDADFTEMVLFCFRYWCKPEDFLQLLIDLYMMPALSKTELWSTMIEKQQVQIRVLKIIKVWVTQFWRPEKDRSVFDMLMNFAQEIVAVDFELTAKTLVERLTSVCCSDGHPPLKRSQIRAEKAMKNFVAPSDAPRSPSNDLLHSLQVGVFENIGPLQLRRGLGASALAQQLTVMEARLYSKLDPEEILEFYILKKENSSDDVKNDVEDTPTISERLSEHAEYTSRLTNWVSHCVLRMTEPASRAVIFSFFINVAKKCVDLRNFSSAHSIWVGLSTYGIDRLRLTQIELCKNNQACETFNYLTKIFDASKHFAACRELIRKSKEPAIPLIGVYRHLFNSLTETVKLFLDSNTDPSIKLINVSVCRKLSSIVQEMEATHAIYKLTGNDLVLGYLEYSFKKSPSAEILTGLCRHFHLQEEDIFNNINKLQSSILGPLLDRLNPRFQDY